VERIRQHCIPQHLIDIIWVAMNTVPQNPAVKRSELEVLFQAPPTYHEFCNSISAKPGKSSGGMTGLTYSMMKCWTAMDNIEISNA
jgi:hypothetical protein